MLLIASNQVRDSLLAIGGLRVPLLLMGRLQLAAWRQSAEARDGAARDGVQVAAGRNELSTGAAAAPSTLPTAASTTTLAAALAMEDDRSGVSIGVGVGVGSGDGGDGRGDRGGERGEGALAELLRMLRALLWHRPLAHAMMLQQDGAALLGWLLLRVPPSQLTLDVVEQVIGFRPVTLSSACPLLAFQ